MARTKMFFCDQCQRIKVHSGQLTTGYGVMDGKKHCFDCCAVNDRETMTKDGNSKRLPLYLVGREVTNWPGTLRLPVLSSSSGRHNWAGSRTDVWFRFNGHTWHGVQYGAFTDVVHCRQTKH